MTLLTLLSQFTQKVYRFRYSEINNKSMLARGWMLSELNCLMSVSHDNRCGPPVLLAKCQFDEVGAKMHS